MALLHFDAYEKIAREHVEDERRRRTRALFTDGMAAYEKQDFDKSLELTSARWRWPIRTIRSWEQYLVQSEAAVERKRTSDMSEAKRQETAQTFAKGMASLEKGDYAEAKNSGSSAFSMGTGPILRSGSRWPF